MERRMPPEYGEIFGNEAEEEALIANALDAAAEERARRDAGGVDDETLGAAIRKVENVRNALHDLAADDLCQDMNDVLRVLERVRLDVQRDSRARHGATRSGLGPGRRRRLPSVDAWGARQCRHTRHS